MRPKHLWVAMGLALLVIAWILGNSGIAPLKGGTNVQALEVGEGEVSGPLPSGGVGVAIEDTKINLDDAGTRVRVDAEHSGTVVDVHGQGISGAVVRWIAVTAKDLEWEPAWHADDWGPLSRSSHTVTTNADGRFTFDERPGQLDELMGSVLWAIHPDYAPASALLGGGADLWTATPTIVLQIHKSVLVSVEDDRGRPVPGARVEHYGMTPAMAAREQSGRIGTLRARRHLVESGITDATGAIEFSTFPGEQVFRAITGNGCSQPWRGYAREHIVLRVVEQFTVGGTITIPDWAYLNYEGERRLTITARTGNVRHSLVALRDVVAGEWGPVAVPIIDGAEYVVRLSGSPIIPHEEVIDVPSAGSYVVHDIDLEIGHVVSFMAVDETDEPIADAEVEVTWVDKTGRENRVSRRAGSNPAHVINAWSVPPGHIYFRLGAPGFAWQQEGPLEVPAEVEGSTLTVELRHAGQIIGRCLNGNEPVENFEIVVWPRDGSYGSAQAHSFFNRTGGFFECATLPIGEAFVLASSDTLPPSKPVLVVVKPASEEEVTIRLDQPLRGVGLVLDGRTKTPISGATFQYIIGDEPSARTTWGGVRSVDSDGTIHLKALRHGVNRIRLSAPGYGDEYVEFDAEVGHTNDLGTVSLERTQAFQLHLVAPRGEVDFSSFRLETVGQRMISPRHFPQDGRLTIGDLGHGAYRFMLLQDYAEWTSLSIDLVTGREWVFKHRVAGPKTLSVRVHEGGGVSLEQVSAVYVTYIDSAGVSVMHARLLGVDGTLVMHGVDADEITVVPTDVLGSNFASRTSSFAGAEALHIDVPLGGDILRVQVVNRDGAPLPGVQLAFADETGSTILQHNKTSDMDGNVELAGVSSARAIIHLIHPELGIRTDIPWRGGAGELDVVLRNDAGLQLRLVDGLAPVGGAQVGLVIKPSGAPMVSRTSAETGVVEFSNLSPGSFRVYATHPECWPVNVEVEATVGPQVAPVQMRFLGDLELSVRDDQGASLPGLRVSLSSVEFGADVERWLTDGLVEGGGLVTDAAGRVVLRRLPRGDYRWTIVRAGFAVETGLVTVEPLAMTYEALRLASE